MNHTPNYDKVPVAALVAAGFTHQLIARKGGWAVVRFTCPATGGATERELPFGATPFDHTRAGKTARDRASTTCGRTAPTGHGAIPGPKKGPSPAAWNGRGKRPGK